LICDFNRGVDAVTCRVGYYKMQSALVCLAVRETGKRGKDGGENTGKAGNHGAQLDAELRDCG